VVALIKRGSQAGTAKGGGFRVLHGDTVRRFWIAAGAATVVSAIAAPSASASYQTLNTGYAKIGTLPKACQDDSFQPDACKLGSQI
jgi:hypothetical protein